MPVDKPLSPHLQIYRLPLTAVLSILHRITGTLLSLGLFVMVIWLVALVADVDTYHWLHSAFSTWGGQLLLIAWTVALYFHLCNGVRHLIWDMGKGFDLAVVDRTAFLVIGITILLTVATWGTLFMVRGMA